MLHNLHSPTRLRRILALAALGLQLTVAGPAAAAESTVSASISGRMWNADEPLIDAWLRQSDPRAASARRRTAGASLASAAWARLPAGAWAAETQAPIPGTSAPNQLGLYVCLLGLTLSWLAPMPRVESLILYGR